MVVVPIYVTVLKHQTKN